MLLGIHALGLSSAIGAINFVVTAQNFRHVCMEHLGPTLYTYSIIVTSLLLLFALPLLACAITGIILDRSMITIVFDGELGGDPLMYQHLF